MCSYWKYFLPVVCVASLISGTVSKSKDAERALRGAIAADFGALPLAFETNIGQIDSQVRYFARVGSHGVWLTDDGAVLGRAGEAPVRLRMTGARKAGELEGLD